MNHVLLGLCIVILNYMFQNLLSCLERNICEIFLSIYRKLFSYNCISTTPYRYISNIFFLFASVTIGTLFYSGF